MGLLGEQEEEMEAMDFLDERPQKRRSQYTGLQIFLVVSNVLLLLVVAGLAVYIFSSRHGPPAQPAASPNTPDPAKDTDTSQPAGASGSICMDAACIKLAATLLEVLPPTSSVALSVPVTIEDLSVDIATDGREREGASEGESERRERERELALCWPVQLPYAAQHRSHVRMGSACLAEHG